MKRALVIMTAFAVCVAAVCAVAGEEMPPQAPQVKSLEMIKSLEGEWVEVGEDGKATETVIATYDVTGAGTAVVETLMPGTPMVCVKKSVANH